MLDKFLVKDLLLKKFKDVVDFCNKFSYHCPMQKMETVKEFFSFLWKRKIWWMTPIIAVFGVVAFLVIFLGSSPLAPLVYPLF